LRYKMAYRDLLYFSAIRFRRGVDGVGRAGSATYVMFYDIS